MDAKKSYEKPKLTELGSVAQLTQLGFTNAGGDCKGGSNSVTSGPACSTPA